MEPRFASALNEWVIDNRLAYRQSTSLPTIDAHGRVPSPLAGEGEGEGESFNPRTSTGWGSTTFLRDPNA